MPRDNVFLVNFSQIHRCLIIITAPSMSLMDVKEWHVKLQSAAFTCIKYNQQLETLLRKQNIEEKKLYRYKYRIEMVQDLFNFIKEKNDRNISRS